MSRMLALAQMAGTKKQRKVPLPRLKGLRLRATLGATGLKHRGGIRGVVAARNDTFYASCGDGEIVHIWDPKTGESLAELKGTDRGVYSIALASDDRTLFVGGHEVQIFDMTKNKRVATLPVKKPLVQAIASSAGVVLYGDDRSPRRFDVARRTELPAMKGHLSQVNACALSADATRALTCGGDRKIKLHALGGKKPEVIATFEGYAKSCGFAPDGKSAWSVGWDHARFFDLGASSSASTKKTHKPTWELGGTLAGGRGHAALSPDGRLLAIAYDEEVVIFALPSKKPYKRIPFHGPDTITFDRNGKRLLVAGDGHGMGEGCGIEVFDVEAEKRVLPADDGHIGGVVDLAIPRDRPKTLVSLGIDARVLLWDIESAQAFEQLGPLGEQGCAVDVTSDAATIVTTTTDGRSLLWDVSATTSRPLPTEKGGRGAVDIAFSPDGRSVAFAPYTPGQAVVFDVNGNKKKEKKNKNKAPLILKGHKAQMCAVEFSPDGSRLFTSSADETVIAWSLPEGEQLFTMRCSGFVNALGVVALDSAASAVRVVTGTTNGEIAVFDAVTGKRERTLRSSGREVHRIASMPDGRFAVVRGTDDWESTVIEIWNLANKKNSPEATADLSPLEDKAASVCSTPDGRHICVGTNKGTILILER